MEIQKVSSGYNLVFHLPSGKKIDIKFLGEMGEGGKCRKDVRNARSKKGYAISSKGEILLTGGLVKGKEGIRRGKKLNTSTGGKNWKEWLLRFFAERLAQTGKILMVGGAG